MLSSLICMSDGLWVRLQTSVVCQAGTPQFMGACTVVVTLVLLGLICLFCFNICKAKGAAAQRPQLLEYSTVGSVSLMTD